MEQSNKLDELANRVLDRYYSDEEVRTQLDDFLSLKKDEISIKEYFKRMASNDKKLIEKSVEIDWDDLKEADIKAYNHELSHKNVWDKYEVNTKLYKCGNEYFILDTNFEQVCRKNEFRKNYVVDIYAEVVSASFKNLDALNFNYMCDVLCYEILVGNLSNISRQNISNVISKYTWK